MKRKPIENPRFIGCLNCTTKETTILDKNRNLCVCGMLDLRCDEKLIDLGRLDEITAKEIEQTYKKEIEKAKEVEIIRIGMLHEETYELDKDSGIWYLVHQGLGMA